MTIIIMGSSIRTVRTCMVVLSYLKAYNNLLFARCLNDIMTIELAIASKFSHYFPESYEDLPPKTEEMIHDITVK